MKALMIQPDVFSVCDQASANFFILTICSPVVLSFHHIIIVSPLRVWEKSFTFLGFYSYVLDFHIFITKPLIRNHSLCSEFQLGEQGNCKRK